MIRNHSHYIVRARISNPPTDKLSLNKWVEDVVEAVDMKVVSGPMSYYSHDVGNQGFTSVAILDFSHIAIHVWDEESPALLEFDLFSCKTFDINRVLNMIDEAYGLLSYVDMYVDRDQLEESKKVA